MFLSFKIQLSVLSRCMVLFPNSYSCNCFSELGVVVALVARVWPSTLWPLKTSARCMTLSSSTTPPLRRCPWTSLTCCKPTAALISSLQPQTAILSDFTCRLLIFSWSCFWRICWWLSSPPRLFLDFFFSVFFCHQCRMNLCFWTLLAVYANI